MTVAPTPIPVDDDVLRAVAAGLYHDPHAVLGAHPGDGGVTVRVLRPFAERVAVVTADGETEATHEKDGIWAAVLDCDDIPSYRLSVTYGGQTTVSDDPYRFLPTIGELGRHLLREGRHERLWTVLGANVHH
ncbi:MAG: 1,4-alpha-glucan branching enzyme, partial [Micrococcales bacterium]|nr:1,4-alpha-glucan branching enzyme [Micrococcales bacterium]